MTTNYSKKVDMWHRPATVEVNGFKYKSLSNWAVNIAVGCSHGCRFCYVPSLVERMKGFLSKRGVNDPDAEWGEYVFLRHWNADVFHASLQKAVNTPTAMLKPDGNRAIMFCSTTDPYQTYKGGTPERTQRLMRNAEMLLRNGLEVILENSDLNVRILTRSPLARQHFDLFKMFGDRLVFGMSLPTLNDKLCRIYEPNAPGPKARLQALQEARKAGLNVFVAMAPTYPECDAADIEATLKAIKKLDPVTIFHEPINRRADNAKRIELAAKELGVVANTEIYASNEAWMHYAVGQLLLVQKLAAQTELANVLHLWPDHDDLGKQKTFLAARKQLWADEKLSDEQIKERQAADARYYHETYLPWLESWWNRISEWPGQKRAGQWKSPALINPFEA